MQRFLLDTPLAERICLTNPDLVHQIGHVLRSAVGDSIVFFDGHSPEEHLYRIESVSKRTVECRRTAIRPSECEPQHRVTIAQAMPNTIEKLEYALQKCVEIGATGFIIFRGDRSQKPLPNEHKRERLEKIAKEALEQCGGCIMPEIRYTESISDAIGSPRETFALDMGPFRADSMTEHGSITLLVWPEGGWSNEEREFFSRTGIERISFGNRVMRTETAAVAGCVMFAHGTQLW